MIVKNNWVLNFSRGKNYHKMLFYAWHIIDSSKYTWMLNYNNLCSMVIFHKKENFILRSVCMTIFWWEWSQTNNFSWKLDTWTCNWRSVFWCLLYLVHSSSNPAMYDFEFNLKHKQDFVLLSTTNVLTWYGCMELS